MSKATDTEIKDLIGAIDRKLDFLTQEVSGIKSEVSGIKSEVSTKWITEFGLLAV